MSDPALFPCLGMSILGQCHYDPKQPYAVYFTLGDAVAATGFTLAVQQLLKPIYLFRLRAYGLRLWHMMVPVFLGVGCTIVASLLPNLPVPATNPLTYPILWELVAALLISVAYGAAALVALRHAVVGTINVVPFIRAAATLLSRADDDDRIGFADDLFSRRNLARLFKFAAALDAAERSESVIELERLRAAGLNPSFTGRPPVSAFYRFAHRRELERASFVGTFLRILSDQDMCSALVRKAPWLASHALDVIVANGIVTSQAQPFVAELGYQAILLESSMLTKELGYSGFRAVPLLSNSLFGNDFIIRHFDPLGRIGFTIPEKLDGGFVSRFNGASLSIMKVIIKSQEFWPHQTCVFNLRHHYKSLCRRLSVARHKQDEAAFAFELHSGVRDLYVELLKSFGQLGCIRPDSLYCRDEKSYRGDLVGVVAEIVADSLECIANNFTGVDDSGWMHAIDTMMNLYPFHDGRPKGMNPLQQQLAVLLIEKLKSNMSGYYPAISRVLLACVGPYDGKPKVQGRTAFVILKDAMYGELKNLKKLHATKPNKIGDFLPVNVAFDAATNTIMHTFRGGDTAVTELETLEIPSVDLFDPINWQTAEIFGP